MLQKFVLDTGVVLGFLHSTNEIAMQVADHLESQDCNSQIIVCRDAYDQLCNTMRRYHFFPQQIYYHYFHRFDKIKKLKFIADELSTQDNSCVPNDVDDQIIVNCALAGECDAIITQDGKLRLSQPCEINLVLTNNFFNSHSCDLSTDPAS